MPQGTNDGKVTWNYFYTSRFRKARVFVLHRHIKVESVRPGPSSRSFNTSGPLPVQGLFQGGCPDPSAGQIGKRIKHALGCTFPKVQLQEDRGLQALAGFSFQPLGPPLQVQWDCDTWKCAPRAAVGISSSFCTDDKSGKVKLRTLITQVQEESF